MQHLLSKGAGVGAEDVAREVVAATECVEEDALALAKARSGVAATVTVTSGLESATPPAVSGGASGRGAIAGSHMVIKDRMETLAI